MYTVNTVYGDAIILPCHLEVPNDLRFGKWKYVSIAYIQLFLLLQCGDKFVRLVVRISIIELMHVKDLSHLGR